MNINILFEDDYLMAVSKPPRLLVVPTPKKEKRTLTNVVKEILGQRGYSRKVYPCHRLDRDTSGIVLFARDRETEAKMILQFKKSQVKKSYIALAVGRLERERGIISTRIKGKEAATRYRVLERKDGYTVLGVETETGRTNQIRIHMKGIGHPLLGERKFAFGKDFRIKFRRTALHARRLRFVHPVTGRQIELKAAIPADMKKML